MPEGHNSICGSQDLNQRMAVATINNAPVGGYDNAVNTIGSDAVPTDRWCASMLKKTDISLLQEEFENSVRDKLQSLKDQGAIPKKGLVVAVGLHKIARYDKKPGEDLTRSKYKAGTKLFERYMTIHCVDAGIRIMLGAKHLYIYDSVSDSLDYLLKPAKNMGVRIRLPLLTANSFQWSR